MEHPPPPVASLDQTGHTHTDDCMAATFPHTELKGLLPESLPENERTEQLQEGMKNETSCDGTDAGNPDSILCHVEDSKEHVISSTSTSLLEPVSGDRLAQNDHKKRQRRTCSPLPNKNLRSRTQRKPEQVDPLQSLSKTDDIPRTANPRAAASKKDTTDLNHSNKKDSERIYPHHHHSKRNSRNNKMLPKKLSSRSVHQSTPTTPEEKEEDDELQKSGSATTPVSNSNLSLRNIQDDIEQYRITNPLIADYNEVLSSQPTSKALTLVQLQHITNGISFAIPDTYSIRYMAQLLGLSHVFQDLTTGNTSHNGKVSMDLLQRTLSERSNPNPNEKNRAATIARNDTDAIYNIPAILTPFATNPRINFWTTNKQEELDLLLDSSSILQKHKYRRTSQNQSHPSQSRSLLLDPFYVHLWESSSCSSIGNPRKILQRVPITAIQHAKIFQSSPPISSNSSVAVALTATTNAITTTNVQNSMGSNVDSRTAEEATLARTESSLEESLSDPDTATANKKVASTHSVTSPPAAAAVPLVPSFVISSQQQDVLQYVLNIANSPFADQRYIFLPFEQVIEKYPQELATFLSLMKVESQKTGVQTGWVAIDTTTNTQSPITTEENNEQMMSIPSFGKIVGLVLYQLEWCAFVESIETSAEMIVHVLGMYVGYTQRSDTLNVTKNNNVEPPLGIEGRRLFDSKPQTYIDDDCAIWLRLVMLSLVFEHARRLRVWYAIIKTKTHAKTSSEAHLFYEEYFSMVPARYDENVLVCDLCNTTVRYTFLQYQEKLQSQCDASQSVGTSFQTKVNIDSPRIRAEALSSGKQRWLVHLPTADDVQRCLSPSTNLESSKTFVKEGSKDILKSESILLQTATENPKSAKSGFVFSNPSNLKKGVKVALSAVLGDNIMDDMSIYELNIEQGGLGRKVSTPLYYKDPPSLHIMRNFPLSPASLILQKSETFETQAKTEPEVYPILSELMTKQKDLRDLESCLEPTLYKLLSDVVSDRLAYENPDRIAKQNEEIRILQESELLRERRIEQDLALQKQLEQDMDAVCEICLDGEVTPDNQILFCESCNVAVHQMCYGIDRVPEGDYYCVPCRRHRLDNKNLTNGRGNDSTPSPICCELCPIRQGAFVRTDIPPKVTDSRDKFVHVLCAKWQGLNHIGSNKELVEDVTNIRREFRRHHVKCDLCQGERGGMNKCMAGTACKKWFHVTCARAVGTMRVIHGENCHGDVEEKAWNLFCPDHSEITAKDVPDNAVSVETLIRAAREFPPEETPPPPNSQFINLTGPERRLLLSDPSYEQALINELLRNKYNGVRCEICDLFDDESKTWTRCVSCNVIFCRFCKLDVDEVKGSYKCVSCRYIEQKRKAKEPFEDPTCCTCVQVGGLLRGSYAVPVSAKFKKRPEFKGSLYAKQTWVHSLCAIWLPDIELPRDIGTVDLSGVICVTHGGTSMIQHKRRCYVCGQKKGLKMHCDKDDCSCNINGELEKLVVHVTCARQAGLEVRVDDERMNDKGGPLPYVRCYRHCGNEFNLRAKLEDLIEIEKKRAGKDHSRTDIPMKLSEASRLLYSAIQVMRIFGWAWRWAEWWVDYNSSWEPLLEPGQKEKYMTKEELKIVVSTRESRCEDARRCRLAAFGAALRNRLYDTKDDFKRTALDKALRAILNTTSLVGPLTPVEIDFYIDWLGRAYRSKSRLLYMGEFKNCISSDAPFCIHEDGTPKYELGNRPLPGEQDLPNHVIFETDYTEIDSFMRDEVIKDRKILPIKVSPKPKSSMASKKVAIKPPVVSKKKSQPAGSLTLTPSQRSNPERRRTPTVDAAYLPPSEGKRRRSALDGNIAVQEQVPTSTKRRGRTSRLPKTEEISDSLVHVAGMSMDDGMDVSTKLSIQSDSIQPKVDNAGASPIIVKNEETAADGNIDTIAATEPLSVECNTREVCEKSPEDPSNSATSTVLEIADDPLDTKPIAIKVLTVNEEFPVEKSQSRSRIKQPAPDLPCMDTYSSVKKRKREPTRPFTYELHEMKGSKRKYKESKNEARSETDVSNKKRRPRLSQNVTKVEISEHTLTDGEPNDSAMPEPLVSHDVKYEVSNMSPNTSSALTTGEAAIEVETEKVPANVGAQDTNVMLENDGAVAIILTESTIISNDNNSTEQVLPTVDVPRTTYTKIRRPGRPRSKNKLHR